MQQECAIARTSGHSGFLCNRSNNNKQMRRMKVCTSPGTSHGIGPGRRLHLRRRLLPTPHHTEKREEVTKRGITANQSARSAHGVNCVGQNGQCHSENKERKKQKKRTF
uniref:Uncharacterized protein n=1 Tax=Trypanosoma congolense (strain IL3000) TaxID=1068625 RepID=G0UM04_TRYCI|nr:hypothetical protein, unlikely [Trypanosoma congolense IL3000]